MITAEQRNAPQRAHALNDQIRRRDEFLRKLETVVSLDELIGFGDGLLLQGFNPEFVRKLTARRRAELGVGK